MSAGNLPSLAHVAQQGRVEDISNKRRFARTADAGYHGERPERELHCDILEVVLHGAFHADVVVPRAFGANVTLTGTVNILQRERLRGFLGSLCPEPALIDDLSPVHAGKRAHVDEQVGSADNVFVVFHHYHGVAQVAQAP